jgi:hypothetical protein
MGYPGENSVSLNSGLAHETLAILQHYILFQLKAVIQSLGAHIHLFF